MNGNLIYNKEINCILSKQENTFYIIKGNMVFEVNEPCARIYSLCNGKNSVEDIILKLQKNYKKSTIDNGYIGEILEEMTYLGVLKNATDK